MKIAITADNHLTTNEKHPDRFAVIDDVFRKCGKLGVELLIIAGDLFDQSLQNYADFEAIYQKCRPERLQTVVIPGNHDPELTNEAIALDGLTVCSETKLLPLDNHMWILLIPYLGEKTMGEEIAPFADQLPSTDWILIGHGDWADGLHSPNPYETGVYMPLTRSDLHAYSPTKVFLGHIHLPYDGDRVHYPGSPCPLNVNETGLRRFLIFDTNSRKVSSQRVDSPRVYFNEQFVMLPVEDEIGYLQDIIKDRIEGWNLPKGWEERVHIRAQVKGYAADRSAVVEAVQEAFKSYKFYDEGDASFDELYHKVDPNRAHIARQVQQWIEELDWCDDPSEPTKDDILVEALKVIYGA